MLEYDPSKRISCKEALNHPYFTEEPLPCDISELPKIEGELKELDFRNERNNKIQKIEEIEKKDAHLPKVPYMNKQPSIGLNSPGPRGKQISHAQNDLGGFSPPEKIVKNEPTIFGLNGGCRPEDTNQNETPPCFGSGIEIEKEFKNEDPQSAIGQKRTQTQAEIKDELDMIQEPQAANQDN